MKSSFTVVLLIVVLLFACKKNEKEIVLNTKITEPVQLVSDKEIYEVIDFALARLEPKNGCKSIFDGNIIGFKLLKEDSLQILSMDSIFTKADLKFMSNQAKWEHKFRLNKDRMRGYHLVSTDTVRAIMQKGYEDHNFDYFEAITKMCNGACRSVSLPFFSINRKYAIIHTGYYCGILCGEGQTYILKKNATGWIVVYIYSEYVS